jgi:Flp pilus assembly protein TadB
MTSSDLDGRLNYHLITIAFLLAAAVCYAAGFALGMLVLGVIGLVLEGVFWIRLFRRRRNTA